MKPSGSGIVPYPVFAQALEAGSLKRVENIAREMPSVSLQDSLRIVELMARDGDARYTRASTRWLRRLRSETDISNERADAAATLLLALPHQPDSIDGLRALVP